VGGKYVWGGTAFKAWDCSGYVQWIYRQAGINLPRVEQWRAGVRTRAPQPGDLVVQNAQGPNSWGHVGIYAGDGMMYSALNPAVGTLLHSISWNADTAYFDLLA
jgi:cell wall-associated NlpC family hydrolase